MAFDEKKQIAAANMCRRVFCEVITDFTERKIPADRLLSAILRKDRSIGSRDRKLISSTIFSFFRWWGWIRIMSGRRNCAIGDVLSDDTFLLKSLLVSLLIEDENPAESELKNGIVSDRCCQVKAPTCLGNDFQEKIKTGSMAFRRLSFSGVARRWADKLNIDIGAGINETPDCGDFLSKKKKIISFISGIPISEFTDEKLLPMDFNGLVSQRLDPVLLVENFQSRPPLWIRVQKGNLEDILAFLREEGAGFDVFPEFPDSVSISNFRRNLYDTEFFRNGFFEIQDFASQMIGLVCSAKPGERWLDLCAGGGGKTLQLASMMKGKGSVLAADINSGKLDELRKRAKRGGFSNVRTIVHDATETHGNWEKGFDGVLIDAPCSCSGIWRRNPDARWRSNTNGLDKLNETQLKILSSASKAVKKDGCLIYATCSVYEKENEHIVSSFLSTHPEFNPESCLFPSLKIDDPSFYISPWLMNSDAVFIAKFRKSETG